QNLRREILRLGVPTQRTDDVSGPDVTDWFAREIVAQIKYRREREAEAYRNLRSRNRAPRSLEPVQLALTYYHQVKYLLSPKWMDFGSPKSGRGVNTVVLEDTVLRKNQLGNIELGIISTIANVPQGLDLAFALRGDRQHSEDRNDFWPPFQPAKFLASYFFLYASADELLSIAYFRVGGRYHESHPHSTSFGMFTEAWRADNLAAFGVGNAIAEELKKLPSMKDGGTPTEGEVK